MRSRIIWTTWAATICACVGSSNHAPAQSPLGPALLDTQNAPSWIAIGDIDGDQKNDIVCTNGTGTISIFRGAGGGAFLPPIILPPIQFQPEYVDVKLADIDRDGKLDVIAVSSVTTVSAVAVYLNLGGSNFASPVTTTVGIYVGGLAVGDLNGDGWPDVVICNAGAASTVKVLLNAGNGTLLAPQTIALGSGVQPNDIELADVDGDGNLDIVTANGGSSIAVLRNQGGAVFNAPLFYAAPPNNSKIRLGDFNNDGRPDVAVAQSGDIAVLLNDGTGAFLAANVVAPGTSQVQDLAAGDLDGDGRLDLVSTTYSGVVRVIRGLGAGLFAAPVNFHSGGRFGAAIGDLDGDGKLDVACARDQMDQVGVLLGDGHGGLGGQERIDLGAGLARFILADLNGDGLTDLIGASGVTATITVRLALANGGFGPQSSFACGAPAGALAVARVDADPFPDLVAIGTDGFLRIFHGDGLGGLGPQQTSIHLQGVTLMAAHDITGDALADIVTSYAYIDGTGSLVSGTSVLRGDGLGGFTLLSGSSLQSSSFAFGDLNGDGVDDLARSENSQVILLLSNGAGGVTQRTFPAPQMSGLQLADVDGDGHLDLLGADHNAGVRLMRGDGAGNLGAFTTVAPGQPLDLRVMDFDGDGRVDVVASGNAGLQCLQGIGTGAFIDRGTVVEGGLLQTGFASTDVNHDGRVDVLIGSDDGTGVVVIHNRGPVNGPVIYCSAKTTSNGCVPTIGASGVPSATATSGFTITCTHTINNKRGLLIYSLAGRANKPFQGATLCLAAPIWRTPVAHSNGNPPPDDCSGVYSIDFNAYAHGLAGGVPQSGLALVGTSVTAQWWGRDPLSTLPGQSTLSDAIDFVMGP